MAPNSKIQKLLFNALIVSVCLLMLIIAAIIIITCTTNNAHVASSDISQNDIAENSSTADTEPSVSTILFSDVEIEVNNNVPANSFTPDDFSQNEAGKITYNGNNAVYGIDVSSFQGEIDWTSVKESGIDFAIIRLGLRGMSKGLLYTDDYFISNIDNAAAAGVDVGVYFFSQAITTEEAKEEAEYVIEVLDGRDLQYPVFFDWEPGTDASDRTNPLFSSAEINDFAEKFCAVINEAGYKSGIYFNSYQGYLQYDFTRFENEMLWLAEYNTSYPKFYYSFDMWQYSYTGNTDGINTPVDMNIFFIK